MAAERVHVFFVLRRGGKNERIVVWDTQDISVGRAPENDVVVDDPEMSRQHARFRKEGAAFLVDNLSTSNPTYVNDQTASSQPLQNRDVVRIAETELVFCRVTQNPVTLGLLTEYASQLKGFGPQVGGEGEATILGLMDAVDDEDDFQVRPAGDFDHDMAGIDSPAQPRNLDLELSSDGLDELDVPREGRTRPSFEGANDDAPSVAGSGTLSLTLEIQGLDEQQQRFLLGLMGKVLQLPNLRVCVKGGDLG
jgi:predicted component of type VI protein secretion system